MPKTLIGQNKDGSPIYLEDVQNTTTPPKPTTSVKPMSTANTGIPNMGIPGIKGITTPILPEMKTSSGQQAPAIMFSAETAKKINAPVVDSLKINERIDNESDRTKQLRQHFDYLKEKGELMLNDKQTDYIKRVKSQYPDYKTVPDAILYGKMILADEKLMEKYGNIGEKSFLRRLAELPVNVGKTIADSALEGYNVSKERIKPFEDNSVFIRPEYFPNQPSNLAQGVILGGTALQYLFEGAMNVVGDVLNVFSPTKGQSKGTTSTTELLGKNVGDIASGGIKVIDKLSKDGEGYTAGQLQEIIDTYKKTPFYTDPATKSIADSIVLGWTNLIGLGAGEKVTSKLLKETAEQALKNEGKKGLFGTVSKEVFDAGMNKSLSKGLMTGAKTTREWLRTLPDDTQKIATTVEKNVNKNRSVLEGIRNTQTGQKILSKADDMGFDPIDDIARYEELRPVIDADGRIDTTQAIDNLNEFVKNDAKTVRELIVGENKRVSVDELYANIKKEIAENSTDIVNSPRWQKVVDDAIQTARRDFGDANGTIPLEVIDDIKKSMYEASNFLNPDDTAIKAIARGAKNTIEDNVTSADIKALNRELSRWYNTRDYLKSIGVGKVIKGGRMGKYFAKLAGQGVGAIAGGAVGGGAGAFLGGAIGGEVADAIQGKILSGALKKTGGAMPESELFGQARKTLSESPALLGGPSGKPTSYPSIYSRGGGQLGRGEFPGNNNTGIGKIASEEIPVINGKGQELAHLAKTLDPEDVLKRYKKLSPEDQVKARVNSDKIADIVKIDTDIQDIREFKGDFGYTPPEVIEAMAKDYLNQPQDIKEMIRKGLDKEDLAELQKINRKTAGLPDPVDEKKVAQTKVPTTLEEKKKAARQITSKGKLAFLDRYDSPNIDGEELYRIAKYAVDNEVEDLDSFMPKPKLRGNSMRSLKKYNLEMEKWNKTKNDGHPFAKSIETAAEDMDMDADELFNDMKDTYNGIESGKMKGGTLYDQVAQMENDYEAQLEAKREMQSIQDQLDTMNDKIDSGVPEYVPEPKTLDTTPQSKSSLPDLISEAKKYKSAEEFVKAQGDMLYHTTPNENLQSIIKDGFQIGKGKGVGNKITEGVFFAKGKDTLKRNAFDTGDTTMIEAMLDKGTKIKKYATDTDFFVELAQDKRFSGLGARNSQERANMALKILKEKGYEAIEKPYGDGFEIIVLYPDKIKTKQQLLDIYEQANKKGIEKFRESEGSAVKYSEATYNGEYPRNVVEGVDKYKSFDEFNEKSMILDPSQSSDAGYKWDTKKWEMKEVDLDELTPLQTLVRDGDKYNEGGVKSLMKDYKKGDPIPLITVDEDGKILNGHQRFEALTNLGIKRFPILQVIGEGKGEVVNAKYIFDEIKRIFNKR